AARRKLEPRKLTRLVSGDLDWIVMKCLEKERARRYETANGLALDLERYLREEPVLAGPPGAGYRVQKFLRRNRGPVLAAGLVLLALVAGVAASTWQALRATQAEADAVAESDQKELARLLAVANEAKARQAAAAERQARELAQKRLGQIKKANDLLGSIFHDL